ncbi:MAG: hypothetical protein WA922_07440 [Pontixanthobacter sp.]
MPIWFELIVLLLATYIAGFGIGAAMWGRITPSAAAPSETPEGEDIAP